ncbi:acyl-CoA dehydrogenase family protein [Pseudothauera rhizosphaerae]|uniref:Acyl-CoA dehydrogenase n=1 Tax=Pseudothauera rhizosphaerae TaxID=2565932 RepID=A0A4S4AYG5_9RHOO|nr:acyl-CoA dehydrogenase family protein [Pseudothauera rhizosphaerae]THF65186.1 acyl-CoA dehydrogenase [Pseudothauera rhizosphaerae]
MSAPAATLAPAQGTELAWFAEHAEALNNGAAHAEELLPQLGRRGLLRIGVPTALGGAGGTTSDALEAIAAVAERSLTAAFVFWGQRTFIEYLLASPNAALRERWLPALLAGEFAGATGLSNAMKYLSGIESLQLAATAHGDRLRVSGRLPWVTNLRRAGFLAAAAVAREDGGAAIVAIADTLPGVRRSEDLNLVALRGSNTAAIDVDAVDLGPEWLIHPDARNFCPAVRPAFLSLQLGMSIGLARVALRTARELAGAAHGVVLPRVEEVSTELEALVGTLHAGLAAGRFLADAPALFRLRIRLAELVQTALGLELDATGGRAYLLDQNRDFARRWTEGAFVPVITPSLTQLQGELARHAAQGQG